MLFRISISLVFIVFSLIAGAADKIKNPCLKKEIIRYNLPIFIGDQIFNDQVMLCKKKGKWVGMLRVPKRFDALLENVIKSEKEMSFSITANEGRGKFQVFYKGIFEEKNKYWSGKARLKSGQLLGPFVGIQSDLRPMGIHPFGRHGS